MILHRRIAWVGGAVAAALVGLTAGPAAAQVILNPVQLRPFAGAFVPVGAQADALGAAPAVGMAASVDVTHRLALTATAWWAPAPTDGDDDRTHVVSADAGVELRPGFEHRRRTPLYPYAGAGAGLRAYAGAGDGSDPAAYLAGGAQFDFGNLGARLETRAYLTRADGETVADLLVTLSGSWRL